MSADTVDRLLDFPSLIAGLRDSFRGGLTAPMRHHHALGQGGAATHLLMPAWTTDLPGADAFVGTKIVNVFPGNGAHGLPAVMGSYLLQSGQHGAPLALIDGTRLTHWRTAAASALAADFLARRDSTHLLMVGAGALAPFLVRAHAAVRPITRVTVWNRRLAGAETVVAGLQAQGIDAIVAADLQDAVGRADIISCATLSTEPLVRGDWLRPGQHVDCVGAFSLSMREVDDAALRRARVYVDTPDAIREGGDVAIAVATGTFAPEAVQGTLADLCTGAALGRKSDAEITLFKSVGAAIEDLAAAMLVWRKLEAEQARI